MEQNKKRKAMNVALSIFLAVVLWMYVGEVWNPDDNATFRGLSVVPVGEEFLESRDLIIVGGVKETVNLKVSAPRNIINRLSSDAISLTVDVSSVQQPGEYTLAFRENFDMPVGYGASALIVTDRIPNNVTFTVARSKTKSVPVKGFITGGVAEGYQAGEFVFSPAMIRVRGEESLINQIESARVTVDQEALTETYTGELPITFMTYSGEILDLSASSIECDITAVQTTLPVTQLKEVPLTVDFLPGGGIGVDDFEKHVEYKITPAKLVISGEEDELESLMEVFLGDIDLSKVIGSNTITFPVMLPNGMTNVSGVNEASVKVSIKGLATATFEVDDIEFINLPHGYKAEKVTTSRQVQVRGPAEALSSVTASQLRIVADLEDVVTASGTQTVPARVVMAGRSDVGVIGEYTVVISVSKE